MTSLHKTAPFRWDDPLRLGFQWAEEERMARHLVNLGGVHPCKDAHHIHALVLGRAITGIAAF